MLRLTLALAGLVLALPALAAGAMPTLSGNVYIHDPSLIVGNGTWASFATGVENAPDGGMPRTKSSPDGIAWHETGAIPGGQPTWIAEELGRKPKNLWAPSVSAHGDRLWLYYAGSSFGSNDSVIGVMTNSRFDAADPAAGWQDEGMVLRSHKGDDYNAIDPFRIDTEDGRAFLAFGSYWDGIRLVELDPATGKPLPDARLVPIASRGGGAIEAPAILHHGGRYYLFVSFDRCCAGAASTYRIMTGRADDIAGPYLDRDGTPLLKGGGTELLASSGRFRGPGGQEVFDGPNGPMLAFHYYDADAGGVPKLQIAPVHFTEDGWPQLDPLP